MNDKVWIIIFACVIDTKCVNGKFRINSYYQFNMTSSFINYNINNDEYFPNVTDAGEDI